MFKIRFDNGINERNDFLNLLSINCDLLIEFVGWTDNNYGIFQIIEDGEGWIED
jgi:hypothetical protein